MARSQPACRNSDTRAFVHTHPETADTYPFSGPCERYTHGICKRYCYHYAIGNAFSFSNVYFDRNYGSHTDLDGDSEAANRDALPYAHSTADHRGCCASGIRR